MPDQPLQIWDLTVRLLTLQAPAFESIQTHVGYRQAWLLFLLGALSRALAEAGILMINRVDHWGFLRSLFGSALALAISALVWAACIWLALQLLLDHKSGHLTVQALVLSSYAPLIFSVLSIVPHLGILWNSMLKVWMLAITIRGLTIAFTLSPSQAVLCAGLGWVAFYLLTAIFGSRAEQLRLRLLGQQKWLKPKQAALAILEREMSRTRRAR